MTITRGLTNRFRFSGVRMAIAVSARCFVPHVLVVLLATACGEESAQQTEALPRPVPVFRVIDANLLAGRALPGQARSAREAMLSFRIAGRIQERRVKTGDQVKEGEILVTLDPAPYQTELDRVAANLQRARAAYANAASQLDRDKQLLDKGIIAKARFENSDSGAKRPRPRSDRWKPLSKAPGSISATPSCARRSRVSSAPSSPRRSRRSSRRKR